MTDERAKIVRARAEALLGKLVAREGPAQAVDFFEKAIDDARAEGYAAGCDAGALAQSMRGDEHVLRLAVHTYGKQNQIAAAMEELGELIAALGHLRRGREGAETEVVEELADVGVMLDQIRIILGPLAGKIEGVRARKIARLAERLAP